MVGTWRWLGVSSMALVLLGCPPKKAAEDGGADASAAATPEAAPAPLAANEADVTKYPGQGTDSSQVTTKTLAHVRTEASTTGGTLVASLKAGTDVTVISDHSGFDLIVFPDPNDGSRKLMGWTSHTVFGANFVPIHVDGGALVVTDAGTIVVVTDGGAVVVPDAGTTPTVADAGPAPAKKLDVKKNADGSCPGGYKTCGAMCRLGCTADADCGLSTAKCTGGFCLGPGAVPCAH